MCHIYTPTPHDEWNHYECTADMTCTNKNKKGFKIKIKQNLKLLNSTL